ncbi:hypothetical protein GLV95_00185 [Staphylococcus agnetis]|uniref:hypothetical protein n=1 Tax=Staphylococcus agnetis TaxID=985762 RepID=UPI001430BE4B|nr:hypothetical protein [Staphylococcus agnetis]NJI14449.1 hypothetical protein [Staphylococcus agnetis]
MDETLQKLYTVLVHFEETDTEITEDENKLRKIKDEIETNLNVSIEKESQSDLIRILKEHHDLLLNSSFCHHKFLFDPHT